MSYAEITFKDPNRIKRFLQRQRLINATKKVMKKAHLRKQDAIVVLDFGCGNAELYKYFQKRENNFAYIGYDPEESFIEEAKTNLGTASNCNLTTNKDELKANHFDVIFCLEVFEHLPDRLINEELKVLESLLTDDGRLVIGVPNEIFLSAFIRGLFRMTRRYGSYDANFKNVFLSVIGFPPKDRHLSMNDSGSFISAHMGFDYRKLLKLLKKTFVVTQTFGSPISFFPHLLNTEVNIICTKKKE